MEAGASCYLLTKRETLMPGTYLGETWLNGLSFAEVRSPAGKIYTARPDNVLDAEAAKIMRVHRRAEKLVQDGYEVEILSDTAYRVYNPVKHGPDGGYRVTEVQPGFYACECTAYAKDGFCKHTGGIVNLLVALAIRAQAIAQRAQELADHARNRAADIAYPAKQSAPVPAPTSLEEKFAKRGLRPDLDF